MKKYFFKRGREKETCKNWNCGNAVYGFGFIGAAYYYVSTASGFWMGVLGLLKAAVWPAILVYEVLKYLVI